jgi:hypothetical protein
MMEQLTFLPTSLHSLPTSANLMEVITKTNYRLEIITIIPLLPIITIIIITTYLPYHQKKISCFLLLFKCHPHLLSCLEEYSAHHNPSQTLQLCHQHPHLDVPHDQTSEMLQCD